MTSDFLATLIRIRQNPYTSSLFNESPIFNDVRFLSDSGFLFSSKKKLCAEVIQTYFCIESISKNIWWHMRTTNLGMMYIFVSQALFLMPTIDRFEIGLVWKWAYMLWKWQHLAILQKWLDLNLLGKYFYATYLYTR